MIDLTEIKRLINLSQEDLNQWSFFGKLTKYIRINENIEDAIELIGIDNEKFIQFLQRSGEFYEIKQIFFLIKKLNLNLKIKKVIQKHRQNRKNKENKYQK